MTNPAIARKEKMELEANERLEKIMKGNQAAMDNLTKQLEGQKQKDAPPVEAAPDSSSPPQQAQQPPALPPLIYFSHPILGYEDEPGWVEPLKQALNNMGYFVYAPYRDVQEQFFPAHVPSLNRLPLNIVPALCDTLKIPKEVTLPFSNSVVSRLIERGDQGERDCVVFKDLWFLVRSAVVICDVMRGNGIGTAHELLYSHLLDIPTILLKSPSKELSIWAERASTAVFTQAEKFAKILPIITGYAPLN